MHSPRIRFGLPLLVFTANTALGVGCTTSAPMAVATAPKAADSLYDPPRDLGQLFHDVQLARVFPDSKTFVDAKPKFAPADIVARYRVAAPSDLKAFVEANFEAPRPAGEGVRADTAQAMEEHIRAAGRLRRARSGRFPLRSAAGPRCALS